MNKIKGLLLVGLLAPWAAVFAVPVIEGDDATWLSAGGGTTEFEVLAVSGSINSGNNLEFGIYLTADPSTERAIFNNGISVGDSSTFQILLGFEVGFYLRNFDTSLGGPYTLYSDSTLNPTISIVGNPPGSDAMFADMVSATEYTLAWEDLDLPIRPGIGNDLLVRLSGIQNVPAAVPEPTSIALFGLAALALIRRRATS